MTLWRELVMFLSSVVSVVGLCSTRLISLKNNRVAAATINGQRLALLLAIVYAGAGGQCAASGELTVVGFAPEPLYRLTRDSDDRRQLTDGVSVRHPLWKSQEAVGWERASPVVVQLKLGGSSVGESGSFRVSVGKSVRASVNVPARIDIYARQAEGEFRHIGEFFSAQSRFADNRSHWLTIPVSASAADMRMVIHASGRYIMMDEIQWKPGEGAAPASETQGAPLLPESSIASDSVGRLKAASVHGGADELGEAIAGRYQGKLLGIWPMRPYETDLRKASAAEKAVDAAVPRVIGYRGEHESIIFGLFNPGSAAKTLKLKGNELPHPEAVMLKRVGTIVAANGQSVDDPLIVLGDNSITLGAHEIAFLWVDYDLSKFPAGHHRPIIDLREGSAKLGALEVDVTVYAWDKPPPPPVKGFNWAYPTDQPIWANPPAVMEDLRRHGVNVGIVPPSFIPQPDPTDRWDEERMKKLLDAMAAYRGWSPVLLYLEWPRTIPGVLQLAPEEQRKVISDWVHHLADALNAAGYSNEQWALYPVDEPHLETLRFLATVGPWIKAAAPAVNIYTNPVSYSHARLQISDLVQMARFVDIWQPSVTVAKEFGEFFQSSGKPWWIYFVPNPPAKAQAPEDYRQLGWAAWRYGALGAGFWAYSATGKTSAWDDFDGKGPDWAVVYEGRGGEVNVTSSRRWEAYRDGLEDFRLLRYVASADGRPGITTPNVRAKILEMLSGSAWGDDGAIQKARDLALSSLLTH